MNEALLLLEEGASPEFIDRAATSFGMPMGPIRLYDLVGLDTALYAGSVVQDAFADRAQPAQILKDLVKAGHLGNKSGSGFYSYDSKGRKHSELPDILHQFLNPIRELKNTSQQPTEQEITDRLFLSMLNEASLVLSENIVREPDDVDMGLILGTGFPQFRGGILRWADNTGLTQIVETLQEYAPLGNRFVANRTIGPTIPKWPDLLSCCLGLCFRNPTLNGVFPKQKRICRFATTRSG